MREKQRLRTDLYRIFELIGQHKAGYFTYVIISAACGSAMDIGFANSIKLLIDWFIYGDTGVVPRVIAFMGASVIAGCVLRPFFVYRQNSEIEKIMRDLRIKTFTVLQELPVSYFERRHSSDSFTAINRAIDTSREAITFVINLVESIVAILLIIPYVLFLDIRFGLTAVFIGVISSVFNSKVRLPLRKRSHAVWENFNEVTEEVIESIMGFNIIKMFGLKNHMKKRFENSTGQLLSVQKSLTKMSALIFGLNAFMGWFNNAFLSAIGCWFVLSGSLSASSLVASVMATSNFTWVIISFGENLTRLQNVFEGINILYNLFNEEREPRYYKTDGSGSVGSISLRQIKFGYESNRPVIHGISIEAMEGKRIALVGNSGGGKSIVINLIMGLYEVLSGDISIL